jgi:hypothetical protein
LAEHVARMGENSTANRLLGRKPESKRPLRRPRHSTVDNIKMDLVEIGWGGVDWIGLAQDRDKWRPLVSKAMNLRVPQNAGELSSGCTTGILSRSIQLHTVSYLMASDSLRAICINHRISQHSEQEKRDCARHHMLVSNYFHATERFLRSHQLRSCSSVTENCVQTKGSCTFTFN